MFSSRSRMRGIVSIVAVVALTAGLVDAVASVTPAWATTVTVTVNGVSAWTDTGIALTAGESVSISASGTINIGNSSVANGGIETPDGAACSELGSELLSFPLPSAPCWSLIGRIGSGPAFFVGSSHSFSSSASGELFLGVNDDNLGDNTGSWTTHVTPDTDLAISAGVAISVPAFSPIGATVNFTVPTASDEDGAVPVVCTDPSSAVRHPGDTFSLGSTTLTCTATDNDDSPSSVSTTVAVTVTPTKPGAPAIGTATAGDGSASVNFTPGRLGSSDTTGFHASCSSSNSGNDGGADGGGSPIVVGGLTNGITYQCSVYATNDTGNSPRSDLSNVIVPGGKTVEDTCTDQTTCNVSLGTGKTGTTAGQTTQVQGTPDSPVGTVTLATGQGKLTCPNSAPGVITPLSTLTTTGFSSSSILTITVTENAVSTALATICLNKTLPVTLGACDSSGNPPPCVISSENKNGVIKVVFRVRGGDPEFKLVLPASGRLLWPSSFPVGKVGSAYAARLQSSGGRAPYHWKIASGKLAAGLTLNGSTGAITGKPKAKGVFSCLVQATDSESPPKAAKIVVSITIK